MTVDLTKNMKYMKWKRDMFGDFTMQQWAGGAFCVLIGRQGAVYMFRTLATLIICLLAVCIGGCYQDEQVDTPVNFLRAEPEPFSLINSNNTITLYFDGIPTNFTSNVGDVVVKGKTVEITITEKDFKDHYVAVKVAWADRNRLLLYEQVHEL